MSVPEEELEGPYLQIGVLCERVLQERDGVLSLIRIVDRFTQRTVGQNVPERMPPLPINATLVLSLKSGFARGSYQIHVKLRTPSGRELPSHSLPVLFEAPHRGHNLIVPFELEAQEEGVYWFDISLNDRLVTRIPLQIVYERMSLDRPRQTP